MKEIHSRLSRQEQSGVQRPSIRVLRQRHIVRRNVHRRPVAKKLIYPVQRIRTRVLQITPQKRREVLIRE